MTAGAVPLAFLAGVLSILSPCVLPILPIVLGAAASEHRFGPAALAGGLSVSFIVIGLFVATIGYSIGLDIGVFRNVAAMLMIAIGAILSLPRLQTHLAVAGAPIANWGSRYLGAAQHGGLAGQLLVGLVLGAPASDRRLGRQRCLRRKGAICLRWPRQCSRLASEPRFPCWRLACFPGKCSYAGAISYLPRATA
jgi:hypothetical protein